ncbi:virulence-associated E family protein, partial [Roseomonas sp. NAR14]
VGRDDFKAEFVLRFAPPPARDGDMPLPGPYPRAWGPEDLALVQAHMQRIWTHRFTKQTVEDAMVAEAARHRFHPVEDWLASLVWDGVPRVDGWLHRGFGCPGDDYHAAAGAKMLIASVKRIRQPGVKFDHTPVFEGGQGLGKSTALRALYGDDWFSDSLPEDLASKDAAMGLLGVWCLELAELQQLIRAEAETVKAFMSRQVDRFRPPYGKAYVNRPRQCILVGTTNAEEWLSDTTGNRRF